MADSRLIGQTSYVYEAGCGVVIDGERTYLTGDWTVDDGATPAQRMLDEGIPDLLFERFPGRLEWHAPWHHDRVLSHLFRGSVDVREANRALADGGPRRPPVPRQRGHLDARRRGRGAARLPPRPGRREQGEGRGLPRSRAGLRGIGVHRRRGLARGPRLRRRGRAVLRGGERAGAGSGHARGDRALPQRRGHRGARWATGSTRPSSPRSWTAADAHYHRSGVQRGRNGRRGGVPPDHVLAGGGGPADHRREHRPRDAALGAHGARDDRPPRGRRLRRPRRRQVAVVHRRGAPPRRRDRSAPQADRALPHRRPGHPLGRGPRGGRAAGARDVTGARGADARGDRRREDLPARASARRGRARARRTARRRRARRERRRPAVRERGRGAPALPEGVGPPPGARRAPSRARTTSRSSSRQAVARTRSRAASRRPFRCAPTRRRRRARRSPSSSCSARIATGADGAGEGYGSPQI